MQKAVPVGEGAMAALIGLEFDAASAVAAEAAQGEVCQAANDNGGRPGGSFGKQGRGRARGRDRQSQRRQARDAAAGVRALPLCADAARCRCYGGSTVRR